MRIKLFLINEQTWIPFTQGCIVLSLVEICPMVMQKKIFRQYIFDISELSSLGKRRGSSFEQSWRPFTQGWIVANFFECHEWFGNFVNVFSLFHNSLKWAKNPWNLDKFAISQRCLKSQDIYLEMSTKIFSKEMFMCKIKTIRYLIIKSYDYCCFLM